MLLASPGHPWKAITSGVGLVPSYPGGKWTKYSRYSGPNHIDCQGSPGSPGFPVQGEAGTPASTTTMFRLAVVLPPELRAVTV
ncbi:MAG TPA: hypothetical protein VMT45_10265 [Thermoanaerobaculaceae bacterium]|nr:hypothetical protein [Thermoanaerobaculaceae bacterium]